jgi:hypothetical protein
MQQRCERSELAAAIHVACCFLSPARERFYNGRTKINGVETDKLNNTTAPEQKRKIIGDTFMQSVDDHREPAC